MSKLKKSVIARVRSWVSKYDEEGREIMDPTPVAIPAGFKPPETIEEKILRLVRAREIQAQLEAQGLETFEDAEDFDVDDDFDPATPFEMVFDVGLGKEVTRAEKKFMDERRREFDRTHGKTLREERPLKRPPAQKPDEQSDGAERQKTSQKNSSQSDVI